MKCPVCSAELKRVLYEGFAVFHCLACHGYLMAERRVESIQRTRRRTIEELKRETLAEAQPDSTAALGCPRCGRKMEKRLIKEPVSLHVDTCRPCEFVWLDGGELARLQLGHEISDQAQEAAEFQRRLRAMTPEARAEFERNLKNLKAEDWSIGSVLVEAFFESLWRGAFPRRFH